MTLPKFTVIIPTRERCDVLHSSIQTALRQDYGNFEILVCDNDSTDDTADVVGAFGDPRIRYIKTPQRLAMSANWEFALNHVEDGWITIIGDDDGLLPGSLTRVADLIRETKSEAIRANGCYFAWPAAIDSENGRLSVSLERGFEMRSCREWLKRVMRGQESYNVLPMLYNGGFVSYDLIRKVKARSGQFYKSMNPDVYSAIVFSSLLDSYVYSKQPLAINGASRHSGGSSTFTGGGRKRKGSTPAKMFVNEDNIPFHQEMHADLFPISLHALTYESYLQARDFVQPDPSITHAQQLEVILHEIQNRPQHRESVTEWARSFAKYHGLDFHRIQRDAARKNYGYRVRMAPASLLRRFNTITLGPDAGVPMRDVYEASLAAATVISVRPSRIDNNIMKLRRRLLRLL